MATTRIDGDGIAARHGERIFRAARTFAPDDDAAWDCVQEALLFAVTSGDPARLERPVEWVCGVATNRARHALRSRGRFRAALERLVRRRRPPRSPGSPTTSTRPSATCRRRSGTPSCCATSPGCRRRRSPGRAA